MFPTWMDLAEIQPALNIEWRPFEHEPSTSTGTIPLILHCTSADSTLKDEYPISAHTPSVILLFFFFSPFCFVLLILIKTRRRRDGATAVDLSSKETGTLVIQNVLDIDLLDS